MDLQQLRDIVVIVYGVVGILLCATLIVVATVLLFAVRALTGAVRDLINDPLKPAINDIRSAIQNIQGTTEFFTDTAVSPLIRVIALGRGIKKGLSIATGFGRRKD